MSSMRNAVQRRNHKERGQLGGREKWGILEKHKDYSLRAKDYNAKKSKLKRLEEKARDRNPDEFHFGMMGDKDRTQGRHGRGTIGRDSAAARGLSHDAIKLLKTQDKGYLRTAGERIRREIERLEREQELQTEMNESLGVKTQQKNEDEDEFDGFDSDLDDFDFSAPPKPKSSKVVFADDPSEQRALKKKRIQNDDSVDEDEDEKPSDTKKTAKQIAAERQKLQEIRRARKLRKRAVEARENKLKALRKQFSEIEAAEREVDYQRSKMDNSVGGTNKNGIKWKIRERKR
ncbi:Small-subunit processome Utp11 [Penicillium atrosanguineum]|uniref:CAZyme family GH47 n=1 Tax=Penicillium atrosanguineum TaxID=1132637 RepID=UPI0023A5071D|nr:CAZyme family GH47 [Penicillium atrosanguineum]KAJ5126806.1 Small-subunit processome Utp11 [Penicillium atrosanguineum]KAJ5147013.1 Small-subunit processome Utp11 [Penicillium atrosanguineum]KAJ5314506.1 CAZyme family GH47 [Penicillium atrosanguineum]